MANIVCFGEVLWDVFPDKNKIGGAPLNVAMRLHAFNNKVTIISAVGKDVLGDKLIDYLIENKVSIDCIKVHEKYKTGDVKVTLNDKGSATYSIEYPRAWDKIQLTETSKKALDIADAFVFGSLATRDEVSRETLYELLELARYKIFDLNLRPPYYSKEILLYLMKKADFIKFNDDELYEVSNYLGSKFKNIEQNIYYISEKTNTNHICVTKGEHGAVLLYNKELYYNSGYQIDVVDTVGAGDSFLGTLISKLLDNNTNPQEAIDIACAVGALVAGREGANPEFSLSDIYTFIKP